MNDLPKVAIVNPADKYKQDGEKLHEYGTYLMACLPKFIQKFRYPPTPPAAPVDGSVWKDELSLMCAPSAVPPIMEFLRDHGNAQFKGVMDITAVDWPSKANRFEVVYNLLSVKHNARIRVKTYTDEVQPVPSIVSIFGGANW
jgi:NADH dehydrogenase (ubiquinone) Fe-S protein 3